MTLFFKAWSAAPTRSAEENRLVGRVLDLLTGLLLAAVLGVPASPLGRAALVLSAEGDGSSTVLAGVGGGA